MIVMVMVLKEAEKYVIYSDGEKAYMCDKDIFYKKYEKSL